MKNQIIGVYDLGREYARLILRDGRGAEFSTKPVKGGIPEITVGKDGAWWEVVSWILHEAMELALLRQGCRYSPDHAISNDSNLYMFAADHTKFAECCAIAGGFIADALPDLQTAWRKAKKRK